MLTVEPLTTARWDDFARLCEQMGSNRGCWCMWWRDDEPRPHGPARQRARELIAESAIPTGVIAYDEDKPVGWAAVSPRTAYPRLNRGRDTGPIDGQDGVWVVPCFFVIPSRRGEGIPALLLAKAVEIAQSYGASIIEGVPGDPATRDRSPSASYTGTLSLFVNAGFQESARRTPKGRVVVRRFLTAEQSPSA